MWTLNDFCRLHHTNPLALSLNNHRQASKNSLWRGNEMKKIFAVVMVVAFAFSIVGFAVAADNAVKAAPAKKEAAPAAEKKAAPAMEKKAAPASDNAAPAKKSKKSKKAAPAKKEAAPAAEKKAAPAGDNTAPAAPAKK